MHCAEGAEESFVGFTLLRRLPRIKKALDYSWYFRLSKIIVRLSRDHGELPNYCPVIVLIVRLCANGSRYWFGLCGVRVRQLV